MLFVVLPVDEAFRSDQFEDRVPGRHFPGSNPFLRLCLHLLGHVGVLIDHFLRYGKIGRHRAPYKGLVLVLGEAGELLAGLLVSHQSGVVRHRGRGESLVLGYHITLKDRFPLRTGLFLGGLVCEFRFGNRGVSRTGNGLYHGDGLFGRQFQGGLSRFREGAFYGLLGLG